jgi:hypothetical protein
MAEFNVKLKLEGVEEAKKQLGELVELGDKLQAQIKHISVKDGDIIVLHPLRKLYKEQFNDLSIDLERFKTKIKKDIHFMVLEDVEIDSIITK